MVRLYFSIFFYVIYCFCRLIYENSTDTYFIAADKMSLELCIINPLLKDYKILLLQFK